MLQGPAVQVGEKVLQGHITGSPWGGGGGVKEDITLRRAIELGLKGPVGVFQGKSGEQEGSASSCGSAQVCDASVPGAPGILPLLPLSQPRAHPKLTRALGAQRQTSQAQSV